MILSGLRPPFRYRPPPANFADDRPAADGLTPHPATMPTAPPFARSIAVVIGIDHYANGIPELRTAVNDARRLGQLLGADHGYDVIAILDADATQERLARLLTKELPGTVTPDDRVLFYFAGHGVARDSDEGPNGYLLPADARRGDDTSYLHMPLVHDALLALTCRHLFVVLDACFSGAFRWSGTRSAFEDDVEVVHQERYDRFVKDAAWQVLTSASQDEKAIDQLSTGALGSRKGVDGHSPFALALFAGIAGAGDLVPRDKGDGLVTVTELALYVTDVLQDAVIAAGKSQTPRLWPLSKHDKGEFVFFVPNRELTLPPAPELTFENNPWRGLTSYDAADAKLFFGRDTEIAALRARINANPLTVVLGASGTGKSSLVKAGVVPVLTDDGWTVLPIVRPGSRPLAALAQAVAERGQRSPATTPGAIAARVAALLREGANTRLVLVIDQFEELITLVQRAAEREQTLSLLARLLAAHPDSLRVVITIRTDFEPNFDRSAFGDRWREGRYVIPLMSRESLRAVIEQPATARVLYFDPSNLVDVLLDDVASTPGALPLLSFALSEMYIGYIKRRSKDRAITRADYDALGGVVGALRSRAESEYEALDEAHRGTLRRVMLRLVTADGVGFARRRASDAELELANDDERARTVHVVQQLTVARLLVQGKEPDGESFVEPAHDALVRGWGRLAEWVREENEARFPLVQQQRLTRAADEWDRASGAAKSGLVWRDSARSSALAHVVRTKALWLNNRELAFAKRSIRGRRITLATIGVALAAITVAGVAAVIGGQRASARAEQVRIASIVRSATAMVSEDPLLASLLLGSVDSAMTQQADDATRLAMLGAALELRRTPRVVATFDNGGEISDAVISPDGRLIATAAADSVVRVWSTGANGARMENALPKAASELRTVEFTPNSARIAVGTADGSVHLWNRDGNGAAVVFRGDAAVRNTEFNADGTRLLVTYDSGPARIFSTAALSNPATQGAPQTIGTAAAGVEEARWADAGEQIAVINSARVLEFWNARVQAAAPTRVVRVKGDGIVAAEASPDGRLVAIGTELGRVQLVEAARASAVRELPRHAGAIFSIGWRHDDIALVTTSADETVHLIDLRGARLQAVLRREGDAILSGSFSRDGSSVVLTSNTTFQAMVWSGVSAEPPIPLAGQTNSLVAATFTPNGQQILTASMDGSVRLWELAQRRFYRARSVGDTIDNLALASFSRNGDRLAFSTNDGVLSLQRLDTVREKSNIDSTGKKLCGLAFGVGNRELHAFRCDGTRASWSISDASPSAESRVSPVPLVSISLGSNAQRGVVTTAEDAVRIWDASDARLNRELMPASSRTRPCAAIAPDGRHVAACDSLGTVWLHTIGAATRNTRMPGARPASVAAFSPNSSLVAIGYENGDTRILQVGVADTGRLLTGQREAIFQVDFSADGQRVLTASDDGTVVVSELVTGAATVTLRPRGREIQSARFTAFGTRILTLGIGQREARIWNADGSGGSIALSGDGAEVRRVHTSPDGRWALVATDAQTAQLYPIDLEFALRPLRAQTNCLSTADRRRYLSESRRDADAHFATCDRRRAAR